DDGYIFLATPNIKGKQIDFNNVNYINKQRYEESPEIKLNIGDILLTKDGSTLGTVNIVRDLPKPATVNSSIAVITPYKNLTSEFLLYLLTSSFMVNTIQRIKGGMGVPHLFQADLNKFYIPIPELAEQFEIVKFLDQETAKIDTLILKAESAIQLMQERRTALISAAVTGKIDVRHWQSPNKNNNQDNMELSA
ncbi:TPA: restriction endonuclease subunit S, partial [Acinetobacter nosocomialis]|nr:restriction endonuclease subunit S [Acinetobacter nosocomialis]